MHPSKERNSRSDPARPYDRRKHGPAPHAKRDERVPCPACDGIDFCEYCLGAGTVRPADADVIRRQIGARETAPIG